MHFLQILAMRSGLIPEYIGSPARAARILAWLSNKAQSFRALIELQ